MFWARRNPSPVSGAGAGPADAGRHLRAGSQRVTACSPVRAPGAFPKCLHSDASGNAAGPPPGIWGPPHCRHSGQTVFRGMVSWALWVEWHPCAHPLDARSTPGHDDHRCPQTTSPAGGGGTYCSVLKLLFEIPCLSGHKSCCPPSEGKPPFGQDPVISVHEPRESWGPSRSWGL